MWIYHFIKKTAKQRRCLTPCKTPLTSLVKARSFFCPDLLKLVLPFLVHVSSGQRLLPGTVAMLTISGQVWHCSKTRWCYLIMSCHRQCFVQDSLHRNKCRFSHDNCPSKLLCPADNRPVFLHSIDLILPSNSQNGSVSCSSICFQPFDLIGCDEGLVLEKPFCQS